MEEMDVLEECLEANDYECEHYPLMIPGEKLAIYDYSGNYAWEVSYSVDAMGRRDELLEGSGSIFALNGEDVI